MTETNTKMSLSADRDDSIIDMAVSRSDDGAIIILEWSIEHAILIRDWLAQAIEADNG